MLWQKDYRLSSATGVCTGYTLGSRPAPPR